MTLTKLKTFFVAYWREVAVIAFASLFFASTAYFNFIFHAPLAGQENKGSFIKFGSPDETANFYFAKLYAGKSQLSYDEPLNFYSKEIVHPRSTISQNSEVKPMSFLGMAVYYGTLAKVFGAKAIIYFTPLYAAIGIFFFFLFISQIFNKNTGLIAAFILACFPPYFFYAARGTFHNVPFIVSLIISLYFLTLAVKKEKYLALFLSFLAGLFSGAALAFRTSELIWLAPAFFVSWLFFARRFGPPKISMFICGALLALLPIFSWNTILFGSPFSGGYPQMNQSISEITGSGLSLTQGIIKFNLGSMRECAANLFKNFFHFGFSLERPAKMIYYYFTEMFYGIFTLAILGFGIWLAHWKKWSYAHAAFISFFTIASVIIAIYYGNWEFYDNPDKMAHTLGNSYTRYFLPIYLAAIAFSAFFISSIAAFLKNKYLKIILVIFFCLFFIISALPPIFLEPAESLPTLIANNRKSREIYREVINLTEPNSIIINQYYDKLFFPERRVIYGLLTDEGMNREYANLAKRVPLYYFNIFMDDKTVEYINKNKLEQFGIKFEEIRIFPGKLGLYKLNLEKISTLK